MGVRHGEILIDDSMQLCYNKHAARKGGSERGDLWRLALPIKEVVHMSNSSLILFLLELIQKGTISSVTVTKGAVTIRIKK